MEFKTLKCIFLLLIFNFRLFGQSHLDSIPQFTIKYNPIPLLLEFDRHLQGSFEHFINAKRSVLYTFGFGNNKIFKNENYESVFMIRAEYRYYNRPFSWINNGRGFKSFELMYKHVQEPYYPFIPSGKSHLPTVKSSFFVNVLATNLKIGREYVDLKYFPAFEIYMGVGARAQYNFTGKIPPLYEDGFGSNGLFGRKRGFRVLPSALVGIGIGIGKWN
jgi:hypothetical protein